MTENEAIERIIRSACSSGKCYDACLYGEKNCEYDVAISVLKEIQQYREIGTVEECKELASMVSTEKKNALAKIIDEWSEYIEIGTVEECREAVDKQKPKRPIREDLEVQNTIIRFYRCPKCKGIVCDMPIKRDKYCVNCGQAIQWDANLEGMEDV